MTNCQKLLSLHKKAAAPMANAGARVKKKPAAPAPKPAVNPLITAQTGVGNGPNVSPGAMPGNSSMPVANPAMPKTAPIAAGMAAKQGAAVKQAGPPAAGAVQPINFGDEGNMLSRIFSPAQRARHGAASRASTAASKAAPDIAKAEAGGGYEQEVADMVRPRGAGLMPPAEVAKAQPMLAQAKPAPKPAPAQQGLAAKNFGNAQKLMSSGLFNRGGR